MTSKTQVKPTNWLGEPRVVHRKAGGAMEARIAGKRKRIVPICLSDVRADNRSDECYLRVAYSNEHPEICLTDEDGQFVDALVDGTYRMKQYLTCMNHPLFVAKALALVKQVMDKGNDGVLIRWDRSGRECHAENMHVAYIKQVHSVASQIPWMEQYDQHVLNAQVHKHLYPGKDQDYAFERFMGKVNRLVKRYGRDRVIVLESDLRFQNHADALFVRPTLDHLDDLLTDIHATVDKPVIVASHPWEAQTKDNLLYALAESWLHGCTYELNGAVGRDLPARMTKLRAGRRLSGIIRLGVVKYAIYENGLAAVNGSNQPTTARLKLPEHYARRTLVDLRTARTVKIETGKAVMSPSVHDQDRISAGREMVVDIPASSGNIYYARNMESKNA